MPSSRKGSPLWLEPGLKAGAYSLRRRRCCRPNASLFKLKKAIFNQNGFTLGHDGAPSIWIDPRFTVNEPWA
jgi:hypothetical protein